jgi:glutathione S-transferase
MQWPWRCRSHKIADPKEKPMARSSKPDALLVGESFSPWTQKARWALEYCGVTYRYAEYTPTLSEPALRLRMRQWSGAVSVPVLFADGRILRGSWEIACHAGSLVGDARLGDLTVVAQWNALSEAALAEGRSRVVRCICADVLALQESLPGFFPSVVRPALRFAARDAVRRLQRKYAHLDEPGSLLRALRELRHGLAAARGDYLLGRFSYADIAMAVVLETIAPIARTTPPLGAATKRCWSDAALAEEFSDLISWRSRLANAPATSYSQLYEPT